MWRVGRRLKLNRRRVDGPSIIAANKKLGLVKPFQHEAEVHLTKASTERFVSARIYCFVMASAIHHAGIVLGAWGRNRTCKILISLTPPTVRYPTNLVEECLAA